jgi:flagellar hook-associated protein 1 FlgK
LQTLAANGQLMGVDTASVQRITNQFFAQEQLSAGSSAAQYDTMADLFDQLNGLLGGPGDNQSLATGLTNLASAFATASQAPTSSASRTGVMNALNNLAANFTTVGGTISSMRDQIDQQVNNSIASTNTLIKQIYDLNMQIRNATATATGSQNSGLQDQRDNALNALAKIMDIKSVTNSDGSVSISTTDGVNLVSNTYAQLSYKSGAQNGEYGNITTQDVDPNNGHLIGTPQPLDAHLAGGSLKGMIDMRDQVLGGLAQTLGNLAQQTAVAFNAQSNANAAYPPPTSLTGRETGLLSTDSLGFTGKTTIAVTGANGNLVSRIDVDFGAGTLRVDGGPPASIGTTIASFTTALNGALGANGTASFIDGKLSIAANGTNGILVKDDATTPSQRGGAGFSQFFGLNDVFQSQMPSLTATGLSAGDPGGFAAGATITVALKGPDGDIGKTASITTTAGQTIGDIVNALNTAMGGAATFTLNSDGSISSSTSALYPGYSLDIPVDNSQRGTTGVSFSQLFGLGSNAQRLQAMGFAVTPAVTANPARLGFATANITSSTVAGDSIVSAGDNSGALALQNVITKSQSFHAAGGIAAQAASLSDYASTFYQNISTSSNTITANQTTQDDRLNEANARVASNSGVNLDEELMSLSSYQQAYAASARMLTVLDQLYKTLLDIQ